MYLHKYRFIDYPTFLEIIDSFVKQNAYCKQNKVGLSEDMAKVLFLVFDQDESGEIEPDEITLFDGKIMSVAKEEKAKQDAVDIIKKQVQSLTMLFKEYTGFKW